jgi:hypothetical protein
MSALARLNSSSRTNQNVHLITLTCHESSARATVAGPIWLELKFGSALYWLSSADFAVLGFILHCYYTPSSSPYHRKRSSEIVCRRYDPSSIMYNFQTREASPSEPFLYCYSFFSFAELTLSLKKNFCLPNVSRSHEPAIDLTFVNHVVQNC